MNGEGEAMVRSRRKVIGGVAALGAVGLAATFPSAATKAQQATPPTDAGVVIGRVRAPTWTFIVYNYQDPYRGNVQNPSSVSSSVRVIAVEVEIANDSPNALPFYNGNIHLRADDGFDYLGSSIYGEEPRLSGRTLSRGDTARGWVWFGIPKDAVMTQIILVAPAPELDVPVPKP